VTGSDGPLPVILDCDPGHDDALAILLALARPELDLLAITTVAGNATLERTTENALRVLALAGRIDVPVAAGADAPLRRPLQTAAHVHGTSGLEGADLPEPLSTPVDEDAVGFIARLLEAQPSPVTLVPTGPLTNIARLLERHPDAADRIGAICLMGGAMGEGNITPHAEFNIWVDPEAAQQIFDSGLPLTMIGLDVTHQALVTAADAASFAAIGNRTGRIAADLLGFFARFHRERYGWDGSPIHDAVAVAHLLGTGLVETVSARVTVETRDETRGRTVVDTRHTAPNAEVGVTIDRARFVDLLRDALATFP
jgi:pyrimidine-specific ribonucleoside hydrolase